MKYLVHDAAGNILRTGNCPDDAVSLQALAGETAIQDEHDDTDDRKHRIVAGKRVEFKHVERVFSYAELRARAYPSIGDQLDALWKGGAEAEAMRAKVQAVKIKYPKPVRS